jgi:enoyl-CoA hydratase/carnithine racemase
MSESLIYKQEGSIVTWTLNEPETRNAISPAIIDAIVAAVHRVNEDMSVNCVILTGAGEGFSSGGNVKNMAAREGMFAPKPVTTRRGYWNGIQRIPEAMFDLQVPSIAAVNGAAVGAGCDLSMMCDIRVASEKAQFAESFLRVGLISGDGGAWYLPRVIGLSKAMEMTFTAEFIDAKRALDMGLCSHLVPHDQLMTKAMEIARKIAQHPPHSIRLNKKLMRDSQGVSLKQALELASCMQAIVQSTDDQLEAVKAMLEKRKPVFKGS